MHISPISPYRLWGKWSTFILVAKSILNFENRHFSNRFFEKPNFDRPISRDLDIAARPELHHRKDRKTVFKDPDLESLWDPHTPSKSSLKFEILNIVPKI